MTIQIDPNRKRRPTLVVTRGLPGCGKTTAAAAWVAADPQWRVRINRDDLREMGHGRRLGTPAQEAIVTGIQHNGARAALAHGTSVVVDDTNLPDASVEALRKIAEQMDADFEVWDFRNVPLAACLARNAQRTGEDRLDDQIIIDMHEEHILNGAGRIVAPATRIVLKG